MLVSATTSAPVWWRQRLRRVALGACPKAALLGSRPSCRDGVCLTFDDGPHPFGTARVLDHLKAAGARATFFLVGRQAAAHPDLVRRMRDEGHEIGNHSWSHARPDAMGAAALADEVRRTREWLESAVGVRTNLFRPPHGKLTVAKLLRLWALRQTVVLWEYDPGDVFQASEDLFVRWVQAHPPSAGDIVLLHDRAPAVAGGLPMLLDGIRRRGLRCLTVSELVSGRAERGHGEVRP